MSDILRYSLVAVILFVFLVFMSLMVMEQNSSIPAELNVSESGIEYKYFTIDGMPCIYITEGVGQSKTGGPSCDWSKWGKQ